MSDAYLFDSHALLVFFQKETGDPLNFQASDGPICPGTQGEFRFGLAIDRRP
jgi:hypothetical protein